MNILHLLSTGGEGGIEILCKDIFLNSKHNNFFCFTYRGGQIAKEMQELNAEIYIFDDINKKNIMKVLKSAEKIVEENNISKIIVHHSSPMSWIIAYYLNRKYSILYYIYVHGNLSDELRLKKQKISFFRKYMYKVTCKKSDGLIAISNSVAKSIKEHLPNISNKINIIYNGVNLKQFKNSNSFIGVNKMPTILFVGRLINEKGVHLLIKAISELKIDIRCLIIGDGPERKKLEELSVKLGVDKKIDFLGMRRNIAEYYKKADLFIHPAIWEEGFGITLVEAMASGLPCVAFNKGAIPEIIEDRISGFIIKEETPEALSKAIDDAINIMNEDVILWKNMKDCAIRKAMNFDIRFMVNKLDKLVEED